MPTHDSDTRVLPSHSSTLARRNRDMTLKAFNGSSSSGSRNLTLHENQVQRHTAFLSRNKRQRLQDTVTERFGNDMLR